MGVNLRVNCVICNSLRVFFLSFYLVDFDGF